MSIELGVRRRTVFAAIALSVTAMATAVAQGSIVGRITSRTNGAPLGDARVVVVGSSLTATSNADGRFNLRSVPQGSATVRVNRLGYEESKQVVTVTNGAEATADFVLVTAIQEMPDVVITATGAERRIEVGNSIGHIEAAKRVRESPIHNMGDLLVAKAPGLTVLPANMSGGGHTIRIRGLNSIERSNAPIFVVDGIRIDATAGNMATGGTNSSRLNDITPEEIENIEVVRGPSAATLYGTDAANGVIVITTKKGRAGAARWNVSSEAGTIQDKNPYEKTYAIWGHAPATPSVPRRCVLIQIADGTCIRDSLTTAHMLREPGISPIATGNRQLHTVQVNGGSEAVRYFVSGTMEGETGPVKMPQVDRQFLDSIKVVPRDEWTRPERFDRGSFRANMTAALSPNFDLNVSSMFLRSEQRLPQVDNNVNSFYYNALTNPGFRYAGLGYSNVGNLGQPLNGWAQFTPAHIFQRTVVEGIKRMIGGATASWRPRSWLQNDGTVGVDFFARRNMVLCRLAECPNFGTQRLGSISDNHNNRRILTANLRSTATWSPKTFPSGSFRTTLGGDYINNQEDGSNASATQLPPGGQTVGSGAVKDASNTLPSATKTLGYYLQEQFAWRDRLWITGAVRSDQNTAFGTKYAGVVYPKLQVSWAASEESFFPAIPFLDALRLRTAYGSSGVQPGATSALRTFSPQTVSIASDQPALRSDDIGNPNLKPELTTEFEAGFDLDAWSRRARFEMTYYSKLTTDALIEQDIATSAAASANDVLKNLGTVKNAGVEALLSVQLLDIAPVAWDITVSASHNDNKVVTLGVDIPTIGTTTRVMAGYPLYSYWLVPYTYADANNDGIIARSEVQIQTGDTAYVGSAFAPDQASIATGVDLLQRRLRINASFDHRGGHTQQVSTFSFLCVQTVTCSEKSDPSSPLWRQARTVAANYTTQRTNIGFYENGRFWRFRELSATVEMPQTLSKRYLRAENVSLSLGARNLKVWTKYTGEDPEASYSQNDTPSTLLTTGPRRYYTARVNVQF